jgi:hypothetical protein
MTKSGTDTPTHIYWDLENRKGLWARGEAMSETPQETLAAAAKAWDAHVVTFNRVMALLREAEAERDALRAELDRPKHETLRQLADAVERNAALKAERDTLRDHEQDYVDRIAQYRNLAISLGATKEQMANDYDVGLVEHDERLRAEVVRLRVALEEISVADGANHAGVLARAALAPEEKP